MNKEGFKQYLSVHAGLANNSIRLSVGRVKLFFDSYVAFNQQNVDEFLHKKQQVGNNNTVNSYVFALRQYQRYLVFNGFASETVVFRSLPKVKPAIDILSPREIDLILNSRIEYGLFHGIDGNVLNDTYRTFTTVLATTGARFSEVQGLRVKHLDTENQTLTFEFTKNKEWRKVPINPKLAHTLYTLTSGKQLEEYIFTGLTGNKLLPQVYSEDLKQRADSVGIRKRVYPHLFRHSFATQLLIRGVSLAHIQQLTGHKDIKSLSRYLHLADKQLRNASMKHDLNRSALTPRELLEMDLETIKGLLCLDDERFSVKLSTERDKIDLQIRVKR